MQPEHRQLVKQVIFAQKQLQLAEAQREAARRRRDKAIRRAIDGGLSGNIMAKATGLTASRVSQIKVKNVRQG